MDKDNQSEEEGEEKGLNEDIKQENLYEKYMQGWAELKTCPRELWFLYIVRFGINSSQFVLFTCITSYLIEVQDISESSVSIIYAIIIFLLISLTIFISNFPDRYGLRITLIISSLAGSLYYILAIIFNNSLVHVCILILILPIHFIFAMAGYDIGIKYYTKESCRDSAASLGIILNYTSVILAGVVIELVYYFGSKTHEDFCYIFGYCLICLLISSVMSLFLRQLDFNYRLEEEKNLDKAKKVSAWEHTRRVLVTKKFWRFFIVVSLIMIIKTIFYQQAIALPLYMDRDMGDDSHFGLMIILNQVLVIILVPFVLFWIHYINSYTTFLVAGLIAVLAPLVFLFGGSYYTVVSHIIITSISEGLFAPTILSYSLKVSPQGKESVLVSISQIPYGLSILVTGITGTLLAEAYCPEDGENKCWFMWTVMSFYAFIALMGLFLFRKCLEEPLFEHNPYIPCSKERIFM
ncbi:hypothetical protein SteCoe_25720 [Stentor coeruleus]|uniref:Major facilitator superfamily (MFS) profile domain-containing protein n=1 Tax=Stentor coeruleus TaxID=5963 RepID=A0A1R2BEK7_9CILI|nr:hypothetical protein SteCoe_25720 [Stentor coeruleus]